MISSCWLGLVALLLNLNHGNQAEVTLTLDDLQRVLPLNTNLTKLNK